MNNYSWINPWYDCKIEYQGKWYQSVTNAFKANMSSDAKEQAKFAIGGIPVGQTPLTGAMAHHEKIHYIRQDWEQVKDELMLDLQRIKFNTYEGLGKLLCEVTKRSNIINATDNDPYWGYWQQRGKNKLGQVLEQVREEVRVKLILLYPNYEGIA